MQELHIFLIESAVVLLLQDSELDLDERLLLRRDTLFDILLEPAQNVRADSFMQFVDPVFTLDIAILLQEVIKVVKAIGINDVQERPHLLHVILDGRSCEQEDRFEVEAIVAKILGEFR